MWTREAFLTWEPMPNFCFEHLMALGVLLVLVVMTPLARRFDLSDRTSQRVGVALGWLAASGYWLWLVAAVSLDAFDATRDLPLEFCYMVGLIAPAAMAWRNQLLFDCLYYGATSGVLHACITPIFAPTWPHPRFLSFWALHGGALLATAWAVGVQRRRPSLRGIFTTFGIAVLLLGVVIPANQIFDANYWYLREAPIGSIQQWMGPWPWFVVVSAMVGLVNFAIAYTPFALLRKSSPASAR